MRSLTIDHVAGAFFIAFALLVLWETQKIPFGFLAEPGPGAMPTLLASTLLVCSVGLVLGGRSGKRAAAVQWLEWRHAAVILGTCAFMALALERLGYRVTIFIALLVLVSVLERKGWITGLVFAAGFSLGSYFLFNSLLHVPLPKGPLGL
ncbi:MAG TPA: tripartite tricarboxylate transporter TctB family protein [Burkholderiales bacterium]